MLEETGLDLAGLLSEDDFIDAQLGDQDTRLFIVQARGTRRGAANRPAPVCMPALPSGPLSTASTSRQLLAHLPLPCSLPENETNARPASPCPFGPTPPPPMALTTPGPPLQGVPETTHFAPHVRYEIGAFGWYLVDHLPASYEESKQVGGAPLGRAPRATRRFAQRRAACTRRNACWAKGPHPTPPPPPAPGAAACLPTAQAFVNEQGGRHRFFNVWPYIKPLRTWIKWAGAGAGLASWPRARFAGPGCVALRHPVLLLCGSTAVPVRVQTTMTGADQ